MDASTSSTSESEDEFAAAAKKTSMSKHEVEIRVQSDNPMLWSKHDDSFGGMGTPSHNVF